LLDDISLLRHCDELWVFTNSPPELDRIAGLAEGVLVELLYFLRACRRPVFFVRLGALLRGERADPKPFRFTYEETLAHLVPSQAGAMLEVVKNAEDPAMRLWPVAYHLFDPLDFKYAHWLRAAAYERGCLPLVPGLAIEIADVNPGASFLGDVVIAWAALARVAQTAWVLRSLQPERGASATAALLECVWRRQCAGTLSIEERRWTDYSIPKARGASQWALTQKEVK